MAKKPQKPNRGEHNPIEEELIDTAAGFRDTLVRDIVKEGTGDFFRQIINFGSSTEHPAEETDEERHIDTAEKKATEIVNLKKHHKEKNEQERKLPRVEVQVEAGIEYHRDVVKSSETASRHEIREVSEKVNELKVELRKLVHSTKALQTEFAGVSMEQTTSKVGEYHINFFEWMISVLREARKKVEESNSWLNSMAEKKSKKMGYWGMFKKHGTNFGLSNERSVATQTG